MRTITRTAAAGAIAAALLLAGCGSDSDGASADKPTTTKAETTTTAAAAELEITDVWARQSPSGATMGAAYLNITSPVDDKLISASVPTEIAAKTEIHETVMSGEGDMSSDTTAMEGDMATTTTMMGDTTETTMGDDMGNMTMKPVESIELPAGEMVELKPGGYHIMLIDLVKPLEVGDTIELTLTFEQAGEKTVTAEVKEG